MCKSAEGQVLNIAEQVESTTVALLTEAGEIDSSQGQTIATDFGALLTDIKNWKSGTVATEAEQVVQDIEAALPLIPMPPTLKVLVPVALAGLATILTLLGANSPAPADTGVAPTQGVQATAESMAAHQTLHAHAVAATGEAKVTELTGYKPSKWDKARAMVGDTHVASDAYRKTWNEAVSKNGLPTSLAA